MKKSKTNLDLPATKRDLLKLATRKELRKFVTKTEFRRVVGGLATKKELREMEGGLRKDLATKKELLATKEELRMEISRLELKMEKRFDEQDGKARQYRDQILTAVQRFGGNTQVLKEEMAIAVHRARNHEERITTLEQKVFASV